MTFGELMDKLNDFYMYKLNDLHVGNESDFRDMQVMVSSGGIQSPMGEFSLMGGRIVFSAVGEETARESELCRIADELGRMNRLKAAEMLYESNPSEISKLIEKEMDNQ